MEEENSLILGVKVSRLTFNQVLEEVTKYLENGKSQKSKVKNEGIKPLVIFTPNPEIVIYAQKDKEFREIVNSAQINIPDGQGLIWASRFQGEPLSARIAGTDFMEKLVELAAKKGFTVGLIGGGEGLAVRAMECLRLRHSNLGGFSIDGFEMGLKGEEGEDMTRSRIASLPSAKKILRYYDTKENRNKILKGKSVYHLISQYLRTIVSPAILFVGFGAPKQEYFICHLSSVICHPVVLMAVGGAFDYLSGRIPRAPRWMQKMGLEWFYRLINQPWRLKRQLALIAFVYLIVREKFKWKKV